MALLLVTKMSYKFVIFVCFLAVSQARVIKKSPVANRILGGQDVNPGEFPHQVSLQFGDLQLEHLCGGSIISERWILTAVHCIEDYELDYVVVKAGKHELNVTERTEQRVHVRAYFKHENYTRGALPYEIALIQLETPLSFNKYVAPINLPKKNSEPSGTVIMSGWGSTTDDPMKDEQEKPNILQKAELEIIDRVTCRRAFAKLAAERNIKYDEDLIGDTNICTGSLTGGLSPCHGDSGGPLISKGKSGKFELVGISSFGAKPCGVKGGPAVYVRVSSFVDWIQKKISEN